MGPPTHSPAGVARLRSPRMRLRHLSVPILVTLSLLLACLPAQSPQPTGPAPDPLTLVSPAPDATDVPVFGPLVFQASEPHPDHAALATQFSLMPAAPGHVEWQADTLLFRPDWPGLAPGVTYTASLGPQRYRFTTAGRLAVIAVVPEAAAGAVPVEATIFVQFNRPVVPLLSLDQPADLLHVEPAVAGSGHWLNTSLYTFKPEHTWRGATTYQVTVPASVSDTLGGSLASGDYRWSFTAAAPAVASVQPRPGETLVDPSASIEVTFNQPIDDPSTLASNFRLLQSGATEPVPGSLTWRTDRTLVFQPQPPLQAGATYAAQPGPGPLPGSPWSFTVAPLPRLLSTVPSPGGVLDRRSGVQLRFSTPLDRTDVQNQLNVEPMLPYPPGLFWSDSDTTLTLYGPWLPSTSYRLSLPAGIHDRFGRPLADPAVLAFTSPPPFTSTTPRLWLITPGRLGTYSAYSQPQAIVRSANISRLTLSLERLSQDQLLQTIANQQPPSGGPVRLPGTPITDQPPLHQWSVEVASSDPDVVSTSRVDLVDGAGQRLAPGAYRLDVRAAAQVDETLFMVSRTAVTMKQDQAGHVLVWAVDLQSGQPLAGQSVELRSASQPRLATATTDADGLAQLDAPAPSVPDPGPHVPQLLTNLYAVVHRAGTPDASDLGSPDWSMGITPFDFHLPVAWQTVPLVASLFTDRPVYRPGQTVHLKGVVRADDDAHYSLPPADAALTWHLMDSQGRATASGPARLDSDGFGTFTADVPLAEQAATGTDTITLQVGDTTPPDIVGRLPLSVAEYRRPEFDVHVTSPAPSVIAGTSIPITVQSAYFFGLPLDQRSVRWRVTAEPWSFSTPAAPGFAFGDRDDVYYAARQVPAPAAPPGPRAEGNASLAGGGTLSLDVPADLSHDTTSQRFLVEATVTDSNDQEVSASVPVIVHKAGVYLGLKPERYVAKAGTAQSWSVVALDPESHPLPHVPVHVQLVQRQWLSVRELDATGTLSWQSKPQDTPVANVDVTSDASGQAQFAITPPTAGEYRVVVEAPDEHGNTSRAGQSLWASSTDPGFAPWRLRNDQRLDLQADKTSYAPGDVAHILVPAPVSDSLALVTIERGKLLSAHVQRLPGNSATIDVPIGLEHVPNAYVSVALFKPGLAAVYRLGALNLPVATDAQRLQVHLAADQTLLQPRQTVTFSVHTQDATGQPVPADVSLALVDAAVLSLAPEQTTDPLQPFWSQHPLGVRTGSSQAISIDQLNEDVTSGKKGGGGGDAAGTRTDFRDTAFWAPNVRTDPVTGDAHVQVTLPDNLTRWRLVADAVTRDTRLGHATLDVVTAKPLLLRPVLPRFLVAGDTATIGAVAHNTTAAPLDVHVGLQTNGAIRLHDTPDRTLQLPAGGQQRLDWSISVDPTAPPSTATVTINATATSGDDDGVAIDLPVQAWGAPTTVTTAGEVADTDATELIDLPAYAQPDRGSLDVHLTPSLAGALSYSLQYVESFPYECLEQTVSRFLPRLGLAQAMDHAGLGDPLHLQPQLPGLVLQSIQRIYQYQHQDGGWGWWQTDMSQPTLTAYALLSLTAARQAGYTVDANVTNRAITFLHAWLNGGPQPFGLNARAEVLYALGRAGAADASRADALYDRRAELGLAAKAYLAQVLASLRADDPRVGGLIAELTDAATTSAGSSHWEEAQPDPWSLGTTVRTTAIVLDTLVRLQPYHPLIPATVRWLMAAQRDGHWNTTQDNALTILALTDDLVATGELTSAFHWDVSLNGATVQRGDTADPSARIQSTSLSLPLAGLQTGSNQLTLSRTPSSAGRLYYSLAFTFYPPTRDIPAEAHGLTVAREYLPAGSLNDGSLHVGDLVRVRLTVIAPTDLTHVVLEDPLPAGLEPVDTHLATTTREAQQILRADAQALRLQSGQQSAWLWNHVDLRDDRVALFATFIPRGTLTYEYLARATLAGTFNVLPAHAAEQYFPDVASRTDGRTLTIAP